MPLQNDFLPFATSATANVLSQTDYAALAALLTGFQSGVANSAQVNKVLRQASLISSVVANFIVDNADQPVVDDGTTSTIEANLKAAIQAVILAYGYAPLASPSLTGTPTAPTPATADNSTKIATTKHVKNVVSAYAPIASPALEGSPTAPTPAVADNTGRLATTAFVKGQGYAPINSPNLQGAPACPTRGVNDNTGGLVNTNWFWQQMAYSFSSGMGEPGYIYFPSNGNPRGVLLQWIDGTTPAGYVANSKMVITLPQAFRNGGPWVTIICNAHGGVAMDTSVWNYATPGFGLGVGLAANQMAVFCNQSGIHQFNIFTIGY